MTEAVNNQVTGKPETKQTPDQGVSDKEYNFRKLEAAREADREARMRAEMQSEELRKEMQEIKNMLRPKEIDPLDGVDDYVDASRLRAKLEKERTNSNEEARRIAKQTYQEEKQLDEKRNYMSRLKSQLSDYDEVMNESNLLNLEKVDPVFLETVLEVPDDYARRLKTYKKIKSMQSHVQRTKDETPSIKEKVEQNLQNPYFIPPSSGTPSAIEFDLSSKASRDQAYSKLKAAQRRPIGTSQASH